jgi:ankyrin repeat protein
MELNINDLVNNEAFYSIIKFYKEKYKNKNFDLLKEFKIAPINWQVWFLGNLGRERVEYLLKNKININLNNESGDTALHWACRKNNLEIFKLLIKYKADVNIKNNDNSTILHYSAFTPIELYFDKKKHKSFIIKYLGNNDYYNYINGNNFKIFELLLKTNIDINAKNEDGNTASHLT